MDAMVPWRIPNFEIRGLMEPGGSAAPSKLQKTIRRNGTESGRSHGLPASSRLNAGR